MTYRLRTLSMENGYGLTVLELNRRSFYHLNCSYEVTAQR